MQTTATGPIEASVDVVILGTGFSGLAAARKIKKAGRSFLVLEARDRLGGRVLSKSIGGGEITEAGATYMGPAQNRMAYLAGKYQVPISRRTICGEQLQSCVTLTEANWSKFSSSWVTPQF